MLLMTANEVETLEKQIENPRHETALCLFWVFFSFHISIVVTQHLRGTKSSFSLDSEMFALSFFFYFNEGHS